MNTEKRNIWLFPVTLCMGLIIFAVTFFIYAEKARIHQSAGYTPGIVGLLAFAVVMLGFTHLAVPQGQKFRLALLLIMTICEIAVFVFLLVFLVLNLYGS
jgi:hypothetical protein